MKDSIKAKFVKSSGSIADVPAPNKPEFAFIGRSNVGKSSLINMLANNKNLAKVSATPGKTISINHFLINDQWYLVDLPGYGFAKRSKEQRATWEKVMFEYFAKRENLYCIFVLIDSRIEPQQNDIEFINKVGAMGIPLAIVFTKTDKNNQSVSVKSVNRFKDELMKYWEEFPVYFTTSSVTAKGREQLLEYIQSVISG
jgi:GTP-binding protein